MGHPARRRDDFDGEALLQALQAVPEPRATAEQDRHLDHVQLVDQVGLEEAPDRRRTAAERKGVTFWDLGPHEAVAEWTRQDLEHVYLDGGQLISSFLSEGLVDDLLLTKIPILLGSGRPLFARIARSTALTLDGVETFPSGIVNLRYSRA